MTAFIWKIIEEVACYFLSFVCRICHKKCTEKMQAGFVQFVKFGIVGVSNTIISYSTYILVLFFFHLFTLFDKYDYLIAQAVGFVLSVLWSFYWNNKIVFTKSFESKRIFWKTLLKTYASYSFTGLFLNSVLLVLWVQVLDISEYVAPIFSLLLCVPLNFIMNKFWAFR